MNHEDGLVGVERYILANEIREEVGKGLRGAVGAGGVVEEGLETREGHGVGVAGGEGGDGGGGAGRVGEGGEGGGEVRGEEGGAAGGNFEGVEVGGGVVGGHLEWRWVGWLIEGMGYQGV